MEQLEQIITNFLLSAAYDPFLFYSLIILLMALATLGLPVSEEVVIISAALGAYMAAHPELYPPPVNISTDQLPVSTTGTAIMCFLAVFITDLFVYMIGFLFRNTVINSNIFKKTISTKRKERIDLWMHKYGYFASGMFRFTPGLRFIGYLTCGISRIPIHKFIMVNGSVALLVVPSQVFLISIYGEQIIEHIEMVALIFGIIVSTAIITLIFTHLRKFINKNPNP